MPGASSGPVPIMRMFGITKAGNSVCAHVHGFHPYLFIEAPAGFSHTDLRAFRIGLNDVVKKDMKSNKENVVDPVLNVEMMNKASIYKFQGNVLSPFIKITVAIPRNVAFP